MFNPLLHPLSYKSILRLVLVSSYLGTLRHNDFRYIIQFLVDGPFGFQTSRGRHNTCLFGQRVAILQVTVYITIRSILRLGINPASLDQATLFIVFGNLSSYDDSYAKKFNSLFNSKPIMLEANAILKRYRFPIRCLPIYLASSLTLIFVHNNRFKCLFLHQYISLAYILRECRAMQVFLKDFSIPQNYLLAKLLQNNNSLYIHPGSSSYHPYFRYSSLMPECHVLATCHQHIEEIDYYNSIGWHSHKPTNVSLIPNMCESFARSTNKTYDLVLYTSGWWCREPDGARRSLSNIIKGEQTHELANYEANLIRWISRVSELRADLKVAIQLHPHEVRLIKRRTSLPHPYNSIGHHVDLINIEFADVTQAMLGVSFSSSSVYDRLGANKACLVYIPNSTSPMKPSSWKHIYSAERVKSLGCLCFSSYTELFSRLNYIMPAP